MYFSEYCLSVFIDICTIAPEPVCNRQVIIRKDVFLQNFVLTDCSPIQVTSCIWQLQHLKESLDCAIFTICSMHDRDRNINCAKILSGKQGCLNRFNHNLVVFQNNGYLRTGINQCIEISEICDIIQCFTDVQFSVFRNINRDDIITICVQCGNCLMGRDDAYFMFNGFTTEEYSCIKFHVIPPLTFFIIP